ncbi:hypothetical protein J4462_02430 [Candidatus Pacearchaeota archaeon]|nr:hypothetical protein [Candidatus Pacearchaeota archaeon]
MINCSINYIPDYNPDDFTTFLSGFSVDTIPNLCARIIGIVYNAKKPHDDFYGCAEILTLARNFINSYILFQP